MEEEREKEFLLLELIKHLKSSSADELKVIRHEIIEGNFNATLAAAAIIYIDSLIREREQQTA